MLAPLALQVSLYMRASETSFLCNERRNTPKTDTAETSQLLASLFLCVSAQLCFYERRFKNSSIVLQISMNSFLQLSLSRSRV